MSRYTGPRRLRRRPLAFGQAPCARELAYSYGCIAHLQNIESQVRAAAPAPPLSAALGMSWRLASAGNDPRGRWAAVPAPPISAALGFCLADGSLPRVTKRLPSSACTCVRLRLFAEEVSYDETLVIRPPPKPPFSAALGITCGGFYAAGNQRGHCSRVKLLASVSE
jgi:hypothetical protein